MSDKNTPAAPADAPAPAGDELRYNLSDPVKPEHGAQVVLAGRARAAARGGLHGDIVSNTLARDREVAAGSAASGFTPDASTPDGRLPPDVATGADQPAYGPAGQGEGEFGSRPGDDAILRAQQEAAAVRDRARQEAAAAAPAPAPAAPAPAAPPPPTPPPAKA